MNKACIAIFLLISFVPATTYAQRLWLNVDSLYQPLPPSVHIYRSDAPLDGKPFIAYYVEADLTDRSLEFLTDTASGRRLKPNDFYLKNDSPLLVVNATFFSFETNRNLNLVMNNSKLLALNQTTTRSKGKDSAYSFIHYFKSAIGFSRKRKADIAWTFTDSTYNKILVSQTPARSYKDVFSYADWRGIKSHYNLKKWKVTTAIGGGPVLIQDGKLRITNEEERIFTGKGIEDKHPRTLMGYTPDDKLIIMVIQGRFPGIAEGASLVQEARLMLELGCVEALNLDGGGSSCLLLNGKETIKPSDKEVQRPVPAVFMIRVR